MTTQQSRQLDPREARSKAVARAVSRLGHRLGYDADIVFEGAIRGATALMLSRGASPSEVSKLLETSARLVGTLDQDN